MTENSSMSPADKAKQDRMDKRQAIRDRYDMEAERIMNELVPALAARAQEKGVALHVNFDVNGAASFVAIEMAKRGVG